MRTCTCGFDQSTRVTIPRSVRFLFSSNLAATGWCARSGNARRAESTILRNMAREAYRDSHRQPIHSNAVVFRFEFLGSLPLSELPSSAGGGELACLQTRSEEHTSELQSQSNLVCRLLLEKKNCHMVAARLKAGGCVRFAPRADGP